MPVSNADIAIHLNELADLIEIEGGNPYQVRAYRTAALSVESYPHNLAEMVLSGRELPRIPGVGSGIAGKITELAQTGHISALEKLERELPGELAELVTIPGLGPRRVKALYEKLGIQSLADLERAVETHQIRTLPGFGEKTEANLREALKQRMGQQKRMRLDRASQMAEPLLRYLWAIPGVKQVIIAGSYRRKLETVGDLDILITCRQGAPVMEEALAYESVKKVVSHGPTRSTLLLQSNLQVDIRVVPENSYGAALVYFTGSKAHNIVIRTMAIEQGLKINEYGVFNTKNQQIAGRTEEEVYRAIGLPYIDPELRENRGEIEAAQEGTLPRLITTGDIRGDLHVHTTATDGKNSIEEMALAAKQRGYEYLAITDHTKHTTIARGMDEARFAEHLKAIDAVNNKITGITVLKSAEVDILEDGSLDLPDSLLKEMDLTVCSIHSHFNLPIDKQTRRVLRAMDNPYFTILGHPTGRKIQERPPYQIDLETIMEAARDRGCLLEINAQPVRLDLSDIFCRMAKQYGLKMAISTDAHRIADFDYIRYGVAQARRGWIEPEDIINTRPLDKFLRLLPHRS